MSSLSLLQYHHYHHCLQELFTGANDCSIAVWSPAEQGKGVGVWAHDDDVQSDVDAWSE